MRKTLLYVRTLLCISTLLADYRPVIAETQIGPSSPCIGYNPESKLWGWDPTGPITKWYCPRNYAYFSLDRTSASLQNGRNVKAVGDCCKLPAEDVLTESHISAFETCPTDFVATGGTFTDFYRNNSPSALRCTKINTERYQLGPAAPGVLWGVASQASFPFIEPRIIMRRAIPLAIRYGIGRKSRTYWSAAGCIGQPAGSLLTEKLGRGCANYIFRELQYRGAGSDPPAGTPVPIIPQCSEITDIFDPDAQCVN